MAKVVVYESFDCIISVVKNWYFEDGLLLPSQSVCPFPEHRSSSIDYNVKWTWREQSSRCITLQTTHKLIAQLIVASSKAQHYVKKSCTTTKILPNASKFYVDFKKNFLKDQKNCYVPSFFRCLAPGQANLCADSPPISIVSRLNDMGNFNWRHFFHTGLFLHCSNARFPKYCGKRALQGLEKSWEVTQPRVPSCVRHLGKFDDVTIYPVLVVARTVLFSTQMN